MSHKLNKKLLDILCIYLIKHISAFFNSIGVVLDNEFKAELEKGLKEIAKEYCKVTSHQLLKIKFDFLTIRAIDLSKLLGIEKASELSDKSLEFCFNMIAEKEPPDIIYALLKNERNFYILINCCFKNYLKKITLFRYNFIGKLSEDRQELIHEKILSKITGKYEHFEKFDTNKAKFKTFLYRALEFATFSTFREEGFENNFYLITKEQFIEFASENNLSCCLPNDFTFDNYKGFASRKEVYEWLEGILQGNNFREVKNEIWNYTKLKVDYRDPFKEADYSGKGRLSETPSEELVTSSEKSRFLNTLKKIERDAFYRLILKVKLGININYLNEELSIAIGHNNIKLELIDAINNILVKTSKLKNEEFFSNIYRILLPYSDKIAQTNSDSIQQRVYRNYNKIRNIYKSEDFTRVLKIFREKIDLSAFECPPSFLMISDEKELEILNNNWAIQKLKVVSLKNNQLNYIPSVLLNLENLEELDLSQNLFTNISEEIKKLVHLAKIDFRNQYKRVYQKNGKISIEHVLYDFSSLEKNKMRALLPNCSILFD